MGAINFKGGFWTGGGSGRLWNGMLTCEEDYMQLEDDMQQIENDLENIKERLLEKYGSELGILTTTKRRKKWYTLRRLFEAVQMENDFLEVNPGYYSGFQLLFNDRVNYYYNDGVEFCIDKLAENINNILAKDDYVVYGN